MQDGTWELPFCPDLIGRISTCFYHPGLALLCSVEEEEFFFTLLGSFGGSINYIGKEHTNRRKTNLITYVQQPHKNMSPTGGQAIEAYTHPELWQSG